MEEVKKEKKNDGEEKRRKKAARASEDRLCEPAKDRIKNVFFSSVVIVISLLAYSLYSLSYRSIFTFYVTFYFLQLALFSRAAANFIFN